MNEVTKANDPRVLRLQSLMDEAGRFAGFVELDPFGERHGSWQRTLHCYRADLDCYVLVALTNLEDGDEIAVSAGAEERAEKDGFAHGPRFRRFDVGMIRVQDKDPEQWPLGVKKLIDQGIRMAVEIQPVQFEERQLQGS